MLYQPRSDNFVPLELLIVVLVQVFSPGPTAEVTLVTFRAAATLMEVERVVCRSFPVSCIATQLKVKWVLFLVPVLGYFGLMLFCWLFFVGLWSGLSSSGLVFVSSLVVRSAACLFEATVEYRVLLRDV